MTYEPAYLAHLIRALAGKSQERVARDLGVSPSLPGHFERGRVVPSQDQLERMAAADGVTLREVEQIARLYQAFREGRVARGRCAGDLLDGLAQGARAHAEGVYRQLLTLPLPPAPLRPEDREHAELLWDQLKDWPEETRLAVVQVAEGFQTWAFCERVCAESETEASRDVKQAAGLARLAQKVAERVPGPQAWGDRLRGYAGAHAANALRVAGNLKAADAAFEAAKELWHGGADAAGLLDPGRLLDLEASLRRGQRRFGEALALLAEALAVGRSPARVLVKKGFTLEVMGEYERSLEALLEAKPLAERDGDRRLQNMLCCNLGFTLCHLSRFAEAAELARGVRACATEMGDEIIALRGLWMQGRIAAGLGRSAEARALLGQARRAFDARGMGYDVALALLEEAALLLEEGRPAEVKALARELAKVFESKGVHREALAALRVFQVAAGREEATAEQARLLLRFLFRARHDQGLRFES
jgi:transcriptional regulator with XRE-family HTH domain